MTESIEQAADEEAAIEAGIRANRQRALEESIANMSPFERKNLLLAFANEDNRSSARTLLDAGRGNPNWIATLPREAFFLLGSFALDEARRTMSMPQVHVAGMPSKPGCANRFMHFLDEHSGKASGAEAAQFLRRAYHYLLALGFDADSVVHEWTQGIVGCEYPEPERILENTQRIVNLYLARTILVDPVPVTGCADASVHHSHCDHPTLAEASGLVPPKHAATSAASAASTNSASDAAHAQSTNATAETAGTAGTAGTADASKASHCADRDVQHWTSWDLFATEGGTAAMCYLFYALKCNFLIQPHDKIALMTPIFTPYLEIPGLNDYDLDVVDVNASMLDADGLHAWQIPDEELEKLADPSIKLLCLVNPSNPPSYAMDARTRERLVEIVRTKNPHLMIITDDVYGTFVPGYRSIAADLPYNTASVYSFSKYFGATGWRLAVIACAQENLFDELIAELPDDKKAVLASRYASLGDDVPAIKFIDRMVADSRLVALNGTAGLSTPQQVQMSLFALFCLLDANDEYRHAMCDLIERRDEALWDSMGVELKPDPLRAGYYAIIDLGIWATRRYSAEFTAWLKSHYQSLDFVLRLAQDTGVVVMDGGGFDASAWSVRVSLANLNEPDYRVIGAHIMQLLDDYATVWRFQQPEASATAAADATAPGATDVKDAA